MWSFEKNNSLVEPASKARKEGAGAMAVQRLEPAGPEKHRTTLERIEKNS
jgi:hypothetical protein